MYRTVLIMLATLLAGGTGVLVMKVPVRADMKRIAQVITGLSFFAILFFSIVKSAFDHNYVQWYFPIFTFAVVAGLGLVRIGDIKRLIAREKPNPWLTETLKSPPITGAPMTEEELQAALAAFDTYYDSPDHPEPHERRFLDDFFIADEADLNGHGAIEVDLDHLDEFIFTARHGYLVHDQGDDAAPCDVITISPGMSIADLIDAAKQHACTKEIAA